MILHDMAGDDVLSLSMFWAGLLMVFAPLIGASVVLGVWWRKRRTAPRPDQAPTLSAQAPGSTTRPR